MSKIADAVFDLAVVAALVCVIVGVWTLDITAVQAFASALLVAAVAAYVARWSEQRKEPPRQPAVPRPPPATDTVSEEEFAETRARTL